MAKVIDTSAVDFVANEVARLKPKVGKTVKIKLCQLHDKTWAHSRYFIAQVISNDAYIINPVCGSGLSYKIYSPLLSVKGIGAMLRDKPRNPDFWESWEKRKAEFAGYEQHLNG